MLPIEFPGRFAVSKRIYAPTALISPNNAPDFTPCDFDQDDDPKIPRNGYIRFESFQPLKQVHWEVKESMKVVKVEFIFETGLGTCMKTLSIPVVREKPVFLKSA